MENPGLLPFGLTVEDLDGPDAGRAAAWDKIVARAESRVSGAALTRLRARWAWAQGDAIETERQARLLVQAEPDRSDSYVWLAHSLLEQGRVEEAISAAERAVALGPNNAFALAVRGCARWRAHDELGAERDLKLALFIRRPKEAYDCLGQIYQAQGETDQAIWAYKHTLPSRVVSLETERTLYNRLATFDLLPWLERIRMGRREAEPCLSLARLYEHEGRWGDARAVYLILLAEDPHLEAAEEGLEALPDAGSP